MCNLSLTQTVSLLVYVPYVCVSVYCVNIVQLYHTHPSVEYYSVTNAKYRCGLSLQTMWRGLFLSVCLRVGHDRGPCKNG